MSFDIHKVRKDFPALNQLVHGRDLVFLDSGASAQKPLPVLETVRNFVLHDYANVHRGSYDLSERATLAYEQARRTVASFLNAQEDEVVFTSGATASFNLLAQSFGQRFEAGDEVLISEMEHHANIVPWQMLRESKGIVLKIIPVTDAGELDLCAFKRLLGPKVKLVSITQASNVLGTMPDLNEIISSAHEKNIPVAVDGSQGAVHALSDVKALDVDFYVFTGHKIYGPTGIGVLYGKKDLLESMPPWQGGGEMVEQVRFERTTFQPPPLRFEAGTPPIIQAVGLATALEYVQQLGLEEIYAHEQEVASYALDKISSVPGLKLYGEAENRVPVFSFLLEGISSGDTGILLDKQGIAVRAGLHCAEPLMHRFGLSSGTVRVSLGMYNTKDEIDRLIEGLSFVQEMFS